MYKYNNFYSNKETEILNYPQLSWTREFVTIHTQFTQDVNVASILKAPYSVTKTGYVKGKFS